MDCPNCGLFNSDAALRCDCGYDLNASDEAARAARDGQVRRRVRRLASGVLLVGVGLWGTVSALESGNRLLVSIGLIAGGVWIIGIGLKKGPQEQSDYVDG